MPYGQPGPYAEKWQRRPGGCLRADPSGDSNVISWRLLTPQPCYCKVAVVPRGQKWRGDANGEAGLRVTKLAEHATGGVRKTPARVNYNAG